MIFDQRKMPIVDLSNSTLVEKACGRLASSFCVTNGVRSLMDLNASENTKLVGVRINKRQQIFFVSKPIWQAPRSNMQRCFAGPLQFSPQPSGSSQNAILCLDALFFRPADGFLLVLPTTVSLAIFFQTGGFFCPDNRPLFPSLRCSEAVMHKFVWSKNCFSLFFDSANHL